MTHNDMVNCVNTYLHKWYVGNNHFENALNLVDDYDEQIRADARRKFAEWLQSNGYYVYVMSTPDGIFTEEVTVDEIISEYEKEQNDGTR